VLGARSKREGKGREGNRTEPRDATRAGKKQEGTVHRSWAEREPPIHSTNLLPSRPRLLARERGARQSRPPPRRRDILTDAGERTPPLSCLPFCPGVTGYTCGCKLLCQFIFLPYYAAPFSRLLNIPGRISALEWPQMAYLPSALRWGWQSYFV
jgi:hypothetical protein